MIPFKVIVSGGFKHGHTDFEQGDPVNPNLYTNHKLTDEQVEAYHKAGFVHIEGLDDKQTSKTEVVLMPHDAVVHISSQS